jgi:hypothetical protein
MRDTVEGTCCIRDTAFVQTGLGTLFTSVFMSDSFLMPLSRMPKDGLHHRLS